MKITIVSFITLLGILVLSRLLPLPPNYEPLLGIAVVLPFITNNKILYYSLPLLVMLVSDMILGFHDSMYATYGAISLTTLFATAIGKPYYGLLGGALIWHILANIGQTFPPFSAEALVFDLRLFTSSLLVVIAFDIATRIRRPEWKKLQT
mgnify:CR=1 FL=1|tara:strand:+ start:3673 stop:4125 length:453 start_codon:yes stop_codon:yes gene_type:complete